MRPRLFAELPVPCSPAALQAESLLSVCGCHCGELDPAISATHEARPLNPIRSFCVVLAGVVRVGLDQLQVLDPVVELVTVAMMHDFVGVQRAAKVLLHNKPVLSHVPPVNPDAAVTVDDWSAALPVRVALSDALPLAVLLADCAPPPGSRHVVRPDLRCALSRARLAGRTRRAGLNELCAAANTGAHLRHAASFVNAQHNTGKP